MSVGSRRIQKNGLRHRDMERILKSLYLTGRESPAPCMSEKEVTILSCAGYPHCNETCHYAKKQGMA